MVGAHQEHSSDVGRGHHELVRDLSARLALPDPEAFQTIRACRDIFGSPYAVTDAAVSSVAAAIWAATVFDALRRDADFEPMVVDGRHAAIAFHSDRFLHGPGLVEARHSPLLGNYQTSDGWIRLHTNLENHRRVALDLLGASENVESVRQATADWQALDLEEAIIDAGGVAGALRSREQWRTHPQAAAVAELPLVGFQEIGGGAGLGPGRWLQGVRVLDLTRVIAGPVAGRFLAAWGADVLRVDAPLDDGLRVQIDTSIGKRRTALDLRNRADRQRFEALLTHADVLLSAFRPGALDGIGYDHASLQALRPGLVVGQLSAYGERGPWHGRRGFDTVVQVVTGLAQTCGFNEASGPGALPAQALDYASGYLLAAGAISGLIDRQQTGAAQRVTVALARTADWLESLGVTPDRPARSPLRSEVQPYLVHQPKTHWGGLDHVRSLRPPSVDGPEAAPPPRGAHEAEWIRAR